MPHCNAKFQLLFWKKKIFDITGSFLVHDTDGMRLSNKPLEPGCLSWLHILIIWKDLQIAVPGLAFQPNYIRMPGGTCLLCKMAGGKLYLVESLRNKLYSKSNRCHFYYSLSNYSMSGSVISDL